MAVHAPAFVRVLLVAAAAMLAGGCDDEEAGGYVAAAAVTGDGFLRADPGDSWASGQTVRLWGYVDHGNLYGDEGAKSILGEWWSGPGPATGAWRFNLKARADDDVGRSFAVHVPNDAGRDALLRRFVSDARSGRSTKVYVEGRAYLFDAPLQSRRLTGLYLELPSSTGIRLEGP